MKHRIIWMSLGSAVMFGGLVTGIAAQGLTQRPQPASPPAPSRSPATTQPQAKGEIVARLGDVEISADDIRADIAGLNPRDQVAIARDPAALSRTVRLLLTNRLVLREAQAKDWERQPGIAARLEKAKEAAIVETFLQVMAAVPDSFPNDAQLQAVYEANMSAMVVPRQFQIAQIFISLSPSGDKDAEEKARRKLNAVQAKLKPPGSNFTAIIASDSDDRSSVEKGGELGWLSDPQLRPEIRAQVVGLEKGGVSDPIKLEDGWHIIKLIDTKASYTRPLSEVRAQLVEQMRDEQAATNRRAYLTKLIEKNPTAINELALSRLLEKSGK
jgi:peptidylprolyl isomerase